MIPQVPQFAELLVAVCLVSLGSGRGRGARLTTGRSRRAARRCPARASRRLQGHQAGYKLMYKNIDNMK